MSEGWVRWELGGWGVIACPTAGPSGLASVFQPPGSRVAFVHKCLLVRLQGKRTGRGEGILVLPLISWVRLLSFSGLQLVKWGLQYYLPGVVLVRTGLDTNTWKAHITLAHS